MPITQAAALSVQDLSRALESLPSVTIYKAREIITLNPARPQATAVAVLRDRILAVGSVEELEAAYSLQMENEVGGIAAGKLAAAVMAHQHDDQHHADHSLAGCVCTLNRIFQAAFVSLRSGEYHA
jgi:pantothenate kinase type III